MKKRISLLLALCLLFLTLPCALAECSVCGGDGKCDTCMGLGFLMARVFGSDEMVQVACTGSQCAGGNCTACSIQDEAVPAGAGYAFADHSVESAACEALGKSAVTADDLRTLTHLDVEILSGPVLLDDLKQMPALETLHIRCATSRKPIIDLAPVGDLSRLQELTVSSTGEVLHLNALLQLPKLQIITLEGTAQQLNLTGLLDQGLKTRTPSGGVMSFDQWYEETIYIRRFDQPETNASLCSACGGEGRQSFACKECDGKGAWECHACGGEGTFVCSVCRNGSVSCNVCSGSGRTTGARACTYCRGTGKRDCYACNGTPVSRCGSCLGVGEVYCRLCDKTGYKTLTCAACGGDGLK